MNNKTKGVIAGIAGIALLGGGTTFALWSDSDTVAGGTITNGNLDVAAVGPLAWFDVSPDRTDVTQDITPVTALDGHAIDDLDDWRMVPGDVAEGTLDVEVALEGDNLVAALGLATTAGTLPTGVTVAYSVYDEDGIARATNVALGTPTALRFAAGRDGQDFGTPVNAPPTIVVDKAAVDGTPNLNVVVTVTFASSTANRVFVTADTVLNNLVVSLNQVRNGADFITTP